MVPIRHMDMVIGHAPLPPENEDIPPNGQIAKSEIGEICLTIR